MDPTKPKYCSTWNVKTALLFFESLKPLEDLTLRQFSCITVLSLVLISAARAHELSLLELSCSLIKEGSWEFNAKPHIKTSRPSHPAPKFFLPSFPENVKICVAYILKAAGVLHFTPPSRFKPDCLSLADKGSTDGGNRLGLLRAPD